MISTTPQASLSYTSQKYQTIEDKMLAIWSKNENSMRSNEGFRELVWYPQNIPVLCWINREADSYPLHWHPAVEIILPISEGYTVKSADKLYELEEGDIILIPPGEMHELIAPPSGLRIILLFDYASINQIPGFSTLSALLSAPILLTKDNAPDIYESCRDILISIMNHYADDLPFWHLSISAMFIQFMILLNQFYQDSNHLLSQLGSGRQKEYIQKFNSVFEFIDGHYMENISLETVAKASGFSKFHFSRVFKQITNTSFNDYLNNRRIQAAITLLSSTEKPITEIALIAGFPSISTFNRVFRNAKGCTPSDFKKLRG